MDCILCSVGWEAQESLAEGYPPSQLRRAVSESQPKGEFVCYFLIQAVLFQLRKIFFTNTNLLFKSSEKGRIFRKQV